MIIDNLYLAFLEYIDSNLFYKYLQICNFN